MGWLGAAEALELTDLKIGIIGLGSIGKALAKRAYAFDMHVTAVDMFPANKPDYVHELWGLDRQNELLAESDIVVVTVPWTPDVQGMIGARADCPHEADAMLVGISRGGIIEQKALAAALREKRIASAALDVFEPRSRCLPTASLWDIENLLIAPHIAGGTQIRGQVPAGDLWRESGEVRGRRIPIAQPDQ